MANNEEQSNIRDNLVENAIKFLQNPQVANSPMEHKKAFLLKKGLTNDEVELAVSRANVPQQTQGPPIYIQPPPQATFWQRSRESLASFVIFGGLAFAAYQFYKSFLKRKLFGKDENEKRLEAVEEKVNELKQSMEETLVKLQGTLSTLQTSLENQESSLKQIVINTSNRRELSPDNFESIKLDITSIKGILLSKDKFAAVPKTTPILPSWQLETDEKSEKQKEDGKTEDEPEIESKEETPNEQES